MKVIQNEVLDDKAMKWTPLTGQRGSVFKVESDNIFILPVRAV